MGNLLISNGGISTNKEGMPSIDLRYGPYASISAAHTALSANELCAVGLTVGIINGNKVDEYWYQEGIELSNLVKKQSDAYTKQESDAKYQPKGNYQPAGDYATKTELNGKVDEVPGKGLSTNDYTNEDKAKVAAAITEQQDISGKADKTNLQAEVARATNAEENLRQLYENLSQSQPIPVTQLPATGEAGKIYRLAGSTSYADYMYNENDLTTPIKMAEYDNAIDDEPTAGSDNLVKSGGVKNQLNGLVFDVSTTFPTGGIEGGNTYTLSRAILTIPVLSRKYDMYIKFIDSATNKYVQYKFTGSNLEGEFASVANWKTDMYTYNKTSNYLAFAKENLLNSATLHLNKLKQSATNISDSDTYSYFDIELTPGEYVIYPRARIVLRPDGGAIVNRDLKEPEVFTATYSGTYTINVYTSDLPFVKLYNSTFGASDIPELGKYTINNNVSLTPNGVRVDDAFLFGNSGNFLDKAILTKGYFKSGATPTARAQYSYFTVLLAPGTYKVGPNSRFILADNSVISSTEVKGWYTFTIDKYRIVDITVFTYDINITKLIIDTAYDYNTNPYGQYLFANNINPRCNVLAGKMLCFCGDSFTEYTAVKGGSTAKTSDNYDFEMGCYKTYPWWIYKRNGFSLVLDAVSGSTMTNINSNSFSNSRYALLPLNPDYIILKFGINDVNESVPIGTIDDQVDTTFYGAWNKVLRSFRERYPLAKIGVIITNGLGTHTDYAEAEIAVAKKFGCGYLNEALGEDIPVFFRTSRNVSSYVTDVYNDRFAINPPNDTHPTVEWHEYESTIVENWIRSL